MDAGIRTLAELNVGAMTDESVQALVRSRVPEVRAVAAEELSRRTRSRRPDERAARLHRLAVRRGDFAAAVILEGRAQGS